MSRPSPDEIRAFSPQEGFNVVQVNADAAPGKRLTLIEHYATRGEAERIAQQLRMADSGRRYEVHGPIGS